MPRTERPLDAGDSALLRFAGDLRLLRREAGNPTYRELARRAHYSMATLSSAAAGRQLPSLAVTLAYVQACGGDPEEWERRWEKVTAEMAVEADPVAVGAPDESSPYPGLAAFQAEDADRFFGRERLIENVVARLDQQRFLAVFGASGAGRSSLLRAGLLTRLRADAQQRSVVLFTPGPHPLEECAIVLAGVTGTPLAAVRSELAADRRGLHRVVRQALTERSAETEVVLVIDQFEEVFTLCRNPVERIRFIDAVLGAVQIANSRCRVVIGVRGDFYAHCTSHPGMLEALDGAQVTVDPMTPDELRLAITQPAVRRGYAVETALLTELVAQASGQVGALPLVSHALLETWRQRRGNTLTLAGYLAAGGIDGALGRAAESAYQRLSTRQRDRAKYLMLRLTTLGDGTEDTSRRVGHAEIDNDPDTCEVLDGLVHARLITMDRDSVQISHTALIRAWPRLRDWLAQDREGLRLHRKLTEATDAWETLDRDPGALYRGARLARTRDWAMRHDGALAVREREFIDASLAAEWAEQRLARRRSRRLKVALGLLSALVILALTAASYAVSSRNSVTRQRDAALSQIVAAKAAAMRRTDPTLAAQLSLAAYRLAPTPEARAGLYAAVPFPYPHRLTGHAANINAVAVSPDGRTIVTASQDQTARLWDVSDPLHPTVSGVLKAHADTVNAAAFEPRGRMVATASWDGTSKLWDITDTRHPAVLATLGPHASHVNAVAFSPDGRTVATASNDRTVKLWDITDPRTPSHLSTLVGHTGVVAVAFRPDGRTLATASFDRSVALWDLTARGRPTLIAGHSAPVTWVAFSADGTKLASASHDGTVRIWYPVGRQDSAVLTGHSGAVKSVAFSPDGRTVATAGEDMTVRLWDVSSSGAYRQVAVLDVHADRVASVAFGPGGHFLTTGGDDTARLWRIPGTWPDRIDVRQIEALVCQTAESLISPADWAHYFPGMKYQPPCRQPT